jgi:hypothetical protein
VTRPGTREPAALDAYLSKLESALAQLSPGERRDILLETRSHVVDRATRPPFLDVDDALAELGPVETYARQFLPEQPPSTTRRSAALGLAQLIGSGWSALPLLALVAVAYFIAVFLFLLAVGKLVEPEATGLFAGPKHVYLYWSSPNPAGRDVLGLWFAPIALLGSLLIHLSVSALLRRVARRKAPNR